MAQKRNPLIYAAALVLVLGGLGGLIWSGFSKDTVYFLNVSEALALPAEDEQACRLFGYVLAEDLHLSDDRMNVRFALEDTESPGRIIPVSYSGVIPDTFGPGAEVIVEGKILAGSFTANTLMTKCASKYESQPGDKSGGHPDGIPMDGGHPDGIPI